MNATTPTADNRTGLTGPLYRYHGFRVLDSRGDDVGQVDWVWTDGAGGDAEFVGVGLQWLRGRARAIPAHGAAIDPRTSTIRVPWSKERIAGASRHRIDREMTPAEGQAIWAHYHGARTAARSRVARPSSSRRRASLSPVPVRIGRSEERA